MREHEAATEDVAVRDPHDTSLHIISTRRVSLMRKKPAAHTWGWRRMHLYGQQPRAEHRAIATRHGQRQPEYNRKMRNILKHLFQ